MKENEVLNAVLLGWGLHPGYRVWRCNSGQAFIIQGRDVGRVRKMGVRVDVVRLAPPGTGDVVGIGPGGQFVGIECKDAKGKLEPEQIAWGEMVKSRGGLWIVARPGVNERPPE